MGLVTISKEGEHVHLFGYEENRKTNLFWVWELLGSVSNQADKRGCREDE
jgi:hypothetical protein